MVVALRDNAGRAGQVPPATAGAPPFDSPVKPPAAALRSARSRALWLRLRNILEPLLLLFLSAAVAAFAFGLLNDFLLPVGVFRVADVWRRLCLGARPPTEHFRRSRNAADAQQRVMLNAGEWSVAVTRIVKIQEMQTS